MREIKFRAWDDKQIVLDWFYVDEGNGHLIPSQRQHHAVVLMQYTGLKDKNGKEIYEGDVVMSPSGVREVAWNQLHLSWGLWTNGGQHENMLADWINDDGTAPKEWEDKSLEVIGNIYENPELTH
jgi:hypothetical protein